jgi:peroxiredoxin
MRVSALLIALSLTLVGATVYAKSYTFLTGAPRAAPNPDQAGIFPPVSWNEYRAQSPRGMKGFVPIRRRPPGLTSHALYGWNLGTRDQIRSWILDRKLGKWLLYLDRSGNGDLSHVTPAQFQNVNGVYRLDVTIREGGAFYPAQFEIKPHHRNSRGQTLFAVSIDQTTERSGSISIDGRSAAFNVTGQEGSYNILGGSELTIRERHQWERYIVGEETLNLFGKFYAFRIRPDGSALTLKELPGVHPQRADLTPGSQAPAFSAKDIDGAVQSLSKYRGRVVLLDFWATFCVPCQSDEPRLVALYRNTRRSDLSILGISADSSASVVRRFVGNAGATWPQVMEASDGPTHRAYRAWGLPTYYLIGRNGQILTTWAGSDEIAAHVTRFL